MSLSFYSNGDTWRTRRKLLTPAFHFRILEDFVPVLNEQARVFTEILTEHENLKAVNIISPVEMATLDVICGNMKFTLVHIYVLISNINELMFGTMSSYPSFS